MKKRRSKSVGWVEGLVQREVSVPKETKAFFHQRVELDITTAKVILLVTS